MQLDDWALQQQQQHERGFFLILLGISRNDVQAS
jgi:hypothetical protein